MQEEVGGEVRSELLERNGERLKGRPGFGEAEGNFAVAGNFGSVEKDETVDKAPRECGAVEARTRFEEDSKNFATAELIQRELKIELALRAGHPEKFDASNL